MRKKSLLVSANAPFIGPRVCLEEGFWRIEQVEMGIEVNVQIIGEEIFFLEQGINIEGPATVQAELKSGKGVSLAVRQVKCA